MSILLQKVQTERVYFSAKTFKNYYDNDSEFRRKHLDKMMERVEYNCGFIISRNNLTKHKWSRNHLKK
jgi:hypothetical protein